MIYRRYFICNWIFLLGISGFGMGLEMGIELGTWIPREQMRIWRKLANTQREYYTWNLNEGQFSEAIHKKTHFFFDEQAPNEGNMEN